MAFNAGSGGGSNSLAASTDVALSDVQDSHVLAYDMGAGKWENREAASGNVFVTTVGAPLPEGLADGTLIARYVSSGAVSPVVTVVAAATSLVAATTMTVTTTTDIQVGDVIAVGVTRGVTSAASTMGTATVSLSSGVVEAWTRGSACRSGTYDTAMMVARVSTVIPSGTTVTITTSGNSNYRVAAIVAGIRGVSSGAPNATSGDDASGNMGDSNHGPSVIGASLMAPTDAATTVANTIVIGTFGIGAGSTYTQSAGQTEIASRVTAGGMADRGVLMSYKVVAATGVQSLTLQSDPTSSMAGVVMVLPLTQA